MIVLKIRYVQELSRKKLNPVLTMKEVDRWMKTVLNLVLHQAPTKYITECTIDRTVLRK